MSLAKKLNLKPATLMRVVGLPPGVDLGDVPVTTDASSEAILVFAKNRAELDALGAPLLSAARADRLAWAAYPKAGQLGTDLNRDRLAQHLAPQGIEPVRQVAIDDVWSALRFRPKA